MIFPISIVLLWISTHVSAQLIDLTHNLNDHTPLYPSPLILEHPFTLTVQVSPEMIDGIKHTFAINSFCTTEHIGTHVDAPIHFFADKWSVEQIPVDHLVANAFVINVQKKAKKFRNYAISRQDVAEWIEKYGPIFNNSIVIANTGWYKRFNDATSYLGHTTNMSLFNSPGFNVEAILFLQEYEKTHGIRIFGYGIDTISLDPLIAPTLVAHSAAFKANQYVVGSLNNLDALPPKGATVMVMPIKIEHGTGAPARVVAQLPYNSYFELTNPRIYRTP